MENRFRLPPEAYFFGPPKDRDRGADRAAAVASFRQAAHIDPPPHKRSKASALQTLALYEVWKRDAKPSEVRAMAKLVQARLRAE